MSVDKRFIVNLQGKDFVTYEGLLDNAHQKGLLGIKTELVSYKDNQAIFKAEAFTEQGCFTGYGDADPSNVNRMIAKHILRMAETRAKARALRDLTNIGMTAFEELGGEEIPKKTAPKPPPKKTFNQEVAEVMEDVGLTKEQAQVAYKTLFEDKDIKDLTPSEQDEFLTYLKGYQKAANE